MAKKHISVKNERVLEALEGSRNASRLIEEAILYYLDSIEKEYVTSDQVKAIIADCIALNRFDTGIRNPNLEMPSKSDIDDILNL